MELNKCKKIVVVTESAIESRVIEDILALGAGGYTVMNARGEGSRGKRRSEMDTDRNVKIEVICSTEMAHTIFEKLHDTYSSSYAMVIYLEDVYVKRMEKFTKKK